MVVGGNQKVEASGAQGQSQIIGATKCRITGIRRFAGLGELQVANGHIVLFQQGRNKLKTRRVIVQFIVFNRCRCNLGAVPHNIAYKYELELAEVLLGSKWQQAEHHPTKQTDRSQHGGSVLKKLRACLGF